MILIKFLIEKRLFGEEVLTELFEFIKECRMEVCELILINGGKKRGTGYW
jgi:hypothetical protein